MLKYDELKRSDVTIMKDIFEISIEIMIWDINNPIEWKDSPALARGNELTKRATEIGIPADYIQHVVDQAEEVFNNDYISNHIKNATEAEDKLEEHIDNQGDLL